MIIQSDTNMEPTVLNMQKMLFRHKTLVNKTNSIQFQLRQGEVINRYFLTQDFPLIRVAMSSKIIMSHN